MQSSRKDRAEYGKDEQPYLQSIQSALIVMFCVNYFTAAQSIRLSPDVNSIVNVYLRGNKLYLSKVVYSYQSIVSSSSAAFPFVVELCLQGLSHFFVLSPKFD
ncbi:hypothetical protein F2Q68_00008897 [Brassica cretica]|uniref:Uncharacterized protein n=1 Tax=Brassica cretica TaxID=69181 RepID=A0A8S9L5K7_BRACR|nr:hypothetical protein F2Q68_00008897 [Brassica cretica]